MLHPPFQYFCLQVLQLNTAVVFVWNLSCEVERDCNFPQLVLLIHVLYDNTSFFPSSSNSEKEEKKKKKEGPRSRIYWWRDFIQDVSLAGFFSLIAQVPVLMELVNNSLRKS